MVQAVSRVTSTEAVRSDLATHQVGFAFLSDTDDFAILTRQSEDASNNRINHYYYVQHPDDNECVWYPYLEAPSTTNNVYYNVKYHDSVYKNKNVLSTWCVDSSTTCHEYQAQP